MDSNPYYNKKLQDLEATLERIKAENSNITIQNTDIKDMLENLRNEIDSSHKEILEKVQNLKTTK